MSEQQTDLLEAWPCDRPVGVLALGAADATGAISNALARDPAVRHWWSASAQNMFVGPSADSPFAQAHLFEARDAENAARIIAEQLPAGSGRWSILLGQPAPARALWVMRALHFALHRLPSPRPPETTRYAPDEAGRVNPSGEQLAAFGRHPPDPPLLALNLNLHRKSGRHPDTGKTASGHELANLYFKRGIRSFNRLGARAIWIGRCRGAVRDDLDVGSFDQIGLVLYPSRRSFEALIRIGLDEGWDRYREAGLERSWVVHCSVSGASARRDRLPAGAEADWSEPLGRNRPAANRE